MKKTIMITFLFLCPSFFIETIAQRFRRPYFPPVYYAPVPPPPPVIYYIPGPAVILPPPPHHLLRGNGYCYKPRHSHHHRRFY